MPALLFKLRNVPDDEADEIRELLTLKHIDFYETNAGNWGISMPGIWVHDEQDLQRGKTLINEYQKERAVNMRRQYEERRAQGKEPGLWAAIAKRPLISVLVFAFCAFIVYVMISPIVRMVQFQP